MQEEQPIAKAYIFSLYPEENKAVDDFANTNCRGNRSEALRRMIAFTVRHFQPNTGVETYIARPEAETR